MIKKIFKFTFIISVLFVFLSFAFVKKSEAALQEWTIKVGSFVFHVRNIPTAYAPGTPFIIEVDMTVAPVSSIDYSFSFGVDNYQPIKILTLPTKRQITINSPVGGTACPDSFIGAYLEAEYIKSGGIFPPRPNHCFTLYIDEGGFGHYYTLKIDIGSGISGIPPSVPVVSHTMKNCVSGCVQYFDVSYVSNDPDSARLQYEIEKTDLIGGTYYRPKNYLCTKIGASYTDSCAIPGVPVSDMITTPKVIKVRAIDIEGNKSNWTTYTLPGASPPPPPPPPIILPVTLSFTADSYSVPYNTATTLRWSADNVDNFYACTASGDWSGKKFVSKSESTGNLTSSKTYVLTCTGYPSGSITKSVTINVSVPSPTITFTADSYEIPYKNSTTLRWSSTNASYCTASGDWSGQKSTTGSELTAKLTEPKYYILGCTGPGGTVYSSASILVDNCPNISGFQLDNCYLDIGLRVKAAKQMYTWCYGGSGPPDPGYLSNNIEKIGYKKIAKNNPERDAISVEDILNIKNVEAAGISKGYPCKSKMINYIYKILAEDSNQNSPLRVVKKTVNGEKRIYGIPLASTDVNISPSATKNLRIKYNGKVYALSKYTPVVTYTVTY